MPTCARAGGTRARNIHDLYERVQTLGRDPAEGLTTPIQAVVRLDRSYSHCVSCQCCVFAGVDTHLCTAPLPAACLR